MTRRHGKLSTFLHRLPFCFSVTTIHCIALLCLFFHLLVSCVSHFRRWQCFMRALDIHRMSSAERNMLPDDPANNFLGYTISTSGRSYSQKAHRTPSYNKYATEGIYPRRILIAVNSQVSHSTSQATSHSVDLLCSCTAVIH